VLHDQGPNTHNPRETAAEAARNARIGLWLFAVYSALYTAFVLINAFAPELMERDVLAGVNLAIAYGFLLIFAALVVALFYGWLCRSRSDNSTAG
jgi:uncharacterized membrane protein (DUF485 family)